LKIFPEKRNIENVHTTGSRKPKSGRSSLLDSKDERVIGTNLKITKLDIKPCLQQDIIGDKKWTD
jgi:hypothetical protein